MLTPSGEISELLALESEEVFGKITKSEQIALQLLVNNEVK